MKFRSITLTASGFDIEKSPIWILREITKRRPPGALLHGFCVTEKADRKHVNVYYHFTRKNGSEIESAEFESEIPRGV